MTTLKILAPSLARRHPDCLAHVEMTLDAAIACGIKIVCAMDADARLYLNTTGSTYIRAYDAHLVAAKDVKLVRHWA